MSTLRLSAADRQMLEGLIASPDTPARLALRAHVVLALASGMSDREVARHLNAARQTVALWRRRVGLQGTAQAIATDAPGRGRKPSVPLTTREAVRAAWEDGRRSGLPRSVRDLARQFGLSPATVHRTLKGNLARPVAAPAARQAAQLRVCE
jgi:transposase